MFYFLILFILIIIEILLSSVEHLLNILFCTYDDSCVYNTAKLNIISHDYEHIDLFIILNILSSRKDEEHVFVVADNWWTHILDWYFHLNGKNKHVKFLFVINNTTQKMIDAINNNKNVWIFLYRHKQSKGIYYVLKATNCQTKIISIRNSVCSNSNLSIKPDLCYNGINMDTDASISNIVFDNINQSFVIEESYLSYSLSQSPEEIMKVIKTKLYNNNL